MDWPKELAQVRTLAPCDCVIVIAPLHVLLDVLFSSPPSSVRLLQVPILPLPAHATHRSQAKAHHHVMCWDCTVCYRTAAARVCPRGRRVWQPHLEWSTCAHRHVMGHDRHEAASRHRQSRLLRCAGQLRCQGHGAGCARAGALMRGQCHVGLPNRRTCCSACACCSRCSHPGCKQQLVPVGRWCRC